MAEHELTGLAWLAQKANKEYKRRPIPENPRPLDEMDFEIIRGLTENGMNITDTAKAKYMGRSTVHYRIKRIEQKTGLNPLDFFDLCVLLKLVNSGKLMTKRFCEDCGKAYEGGPQAHFCPDCRKQRLSDNAKKRGLCYMGGAANAAKKGK